MSVTHHSVTIPSQDNAPNPSGTLQFPEQDGPLVDNLLQVSPPCMVIGHSHNINLLFCADQGFSLGDNDPAVFGPDDTVTFDYNPPLS